jgi:hypothetical protein
LRAKIAAMSIRGEITEAQKRKGERLAREYGWFDEDDFAERGATREPAVRVLRPPTLYAAGPGLARWGLGWGPATGEQENKTP